MRKKKIKLCQYYFLQKQQKFILADTEFSGILNLQKKRYLIIKIYQFLINRIVFTNFQLPRLTEQIFIEQRF